MSKKKKATTKRRVSAKGKPSRLDPNVVIVAPVCEECGWGEGAKPTVKGALCPKCSATVTGQAVSRAAFSKALEARAGEADAGAEG